MLDSLYIARCISHILYQGDAHGNLRMPLGQISKILENDRVLFSRVLAMHLRIPELDVYQEMINIGND